MSVKYVLSRVRHKDTPNETRVYFKNRHWDGEVCSTFIPDEANVMKSEGFAGSVANMINRNFGEGADPWRVHAVAV